MNKHSKGLYTSEVKKGLLLHGLEDKQEMATQGKYCRQREKHAQRP